LSECNKLEVLNCSNNLSLKGIDLSPVAESLKTFLCFKTDIKKLNVKNLKKLQKLYCHFCTFDELDCSDLEELRELYCFGGVFLTSPGQQKKRSGLKKLNVKGCKKLEILDCAENLLTNFLLEEHPNLHTFSCKANEIKILAIKNCVNLAYFDFSSQGK